MVKTVARSSSLGRLLFSSAVKMVAQQGVQKAIDDAMRTLEHDGAVGEARLVKWLADVTASLDSVEAVEELQGRSESCLVYRGLQLPVVAKSPARLAELTMRLAIRSVAAAAGDLVLLPGEEALADEKIDWKFSVTSAVVARANRARKQLSAVVRETMDPSQGMSGEDVKVGDSGIE